ncbi:MAG: DNA polymerase Y family protein [Ectothiorhodospiraceae bacterium]|nr:DNA polymerase Y family protein [Chromatiales bacterium]MCP5153731.1 DNA polymerase Y family protein [Ectothiorhodospiraceae bacterium]
MSARRARSLALALPEVARDGSGSVEVVAPARRARHRERPLPARLWLAIELPRLALEAHHRRDPTAPPMAVGDGRGRRPRVVAANDQALAAGVEPGMALATASALVPALRMLGRDSAVESAALADLGAWCEQFSSLVSLEPPDVVLVEIGASLRLLGGLGPLRRAVEAGVEGLGLTARTAVAPTPSSAVLLARAGIREPVTDPNALAARLAPVPVECLGLPADAVQMLRAVGADRLADCLRLPRDGLARRVGPAVLALLDRALGRHPDPREPHRAPEVFERALTWPDAISDLERVLHGARCLLEELAGFLRGRDAGARAVEVLLAHRGLPATRVVLGLTAPSRDPVHLLGLLAARLERVELVHPVEQLGMRVVDLAPLAPTATDLFAAPGGSVRPDGGAADGWPRLVERLRARLEARAVHGLAITADHRPERAWRARGDAEPARPHPSVPAPPRRPLWLLEIPRPLVVTAGVPRHRGPLALIEGPERIETGWWDGEDVRRDYYLAGNPRGERFWIYRERDGERGWYLHGVFG